MEVNDGRGIHDMLAIDYRIYASDVNKMFVVARMSAIGDRWPDTIINPDSGLTYNFKSNEIMEDWMIGNYSGHAKYIRI